MKKKESNKNKERIKRMKAIKKQNKERMKKNERQKFILEIQSGRDTPKISAKSVIVNCRQFISTGSRITSHQLRHPPTLLRTHSLVYTHARTHTNTHKR